MFSSSFFLFLVLFFLLFHSHQIEIYSFFFLLLNYENDKKIDKLCINEQIWTSWWNRWSWIGMNVFFLEKILICVVVCCRPSFSKKKKRKLFFIYINKNKITWTKSTANRRRRQFSTTTAIEESLCFLMRRVFFSVSLFRLLFSD